jgi:ArsR family transcriptional regulator
VFIALGFEPRLRILDVLAAGPVCVAEIAEAIGLSQPTASHHLRILRHAGLVDSTRTGKFNHFHALPLATTLVKAARAALAATRPVDTAAGAGILVVPAGTPTVSWATHCGV